MMAGASVVHHIVKPDLSLSSASATPSTATVTDVAFSIPNVNVGKQDSMEADGPCPAESNAREMR